MFTEAPPVTVSESVIYVSWGGTGRAASLRQALHRAEEDERAFTYLAVLDDEHFDDLDHSVIELMVEELEWLLDAQLELAPLPWIDVVGGLVSEMYDKQLMTINFARSAKASFLTMDREFARAAREPGMFQSEEFLEIMEDGQESFLEDLDVVREIVTEWVPDVLEAGSAA